MLMKRLSAVVLGVIGLASIQTSAENFNGEIEVGFFSGIIDRSSNQEDDISGGNGEITLYFSTVEAIEGPLAEASFLEKTSYISGSFKSTNTEMGATDRDRTESALSGRFVDKQRGVILNLGYANSEVDSINEETTVVNAGLGKYITDNITLGASYSSVSEDSAGTETDSDSWAIDFKMVGAFGKNFTYAAEAGAGVVQADGDDGSIVDLTFTAYPLRNLGFGGSYSYEDDGSEETDSFEVFGEWFITGMFSVSAAYSFSQQDPDDDETQDFSVGARIRF